MKVAIVYDRVNRWGGAERVLLALHEIFPDAPLFTSLYEPKLAPWGKLFPGVIPSFLNKLSYFRKRHEILPIFMPLAFENFCFDKFNLVISVSSEAAKGIITKPGVLHVCYCLTPTRYLWSHYEQYFKGPSFKVLAKPAVCYLRKWDKVAAQRPDVMVAISSEVKTRIKKYYGRDSEIIYPPVETEKFKIPSGSETLKGRRQNSLWVGEPSGSETKDKSGNTTSRYEQSLRLRQSDVVKSGGAGESEYYLVVSRLVPYKKVDLVIEAFNQLGYPLVVVGVGSEEKRLKRMAKGNIKFTGFVDDVRLKKIYQNAKALIFPQEEDFGIVPVEAQASGCPVIAFKKGGVLDTVVDGKTGVFFKQQNVKSLIDAVKTLEKKKFNKVLLRKSAEKFSKERFKIEFLDLVIRNV